MVQMSIALPCHQDITSPDATAIQNSITLGERCGLEREEKDKTIKTDSDAFPPNRWFHLTLVEISSNMWFVSFWFDMLYKYIYLINNNKPCPCFQQSLKACFFLFYFIGLGAKGMKDKKRKTVLKLEHV